MALVLSLAGCPEAHSTTGDDAGTPPGDGGPVVSTCRAAMAAASGAACISFEYCVDPFPCDTTRWTCDAGRLVIEHAACDGGVPLDGGMCAPANPTSGAGCRSDSDCSASAFERCLAPDENPGCGICRPPTRACLTDADCAAPGAMPRVCREFIDPCSTIGGGIACGPGGDPTSSECIPRCEAAGCGLGDACGSDGHCAAIPCGSEYACPVGTECGFGGGFGDAHGCRRLSCTADTDCPCGSGCVESLCHSVLGLCEPPRA